MNITVKHPVTEFAQISFVDVGEHLIGDEIWQRVELASGHFLGGVVEVAYVSDDTTAIRHSGDNNNIFLLCHINEKNPQRYIRALARYFKAHNTSQVFRDMVESAILEVEMLNV